jgi:hypothetical protein
MTIHRWVTRAKCPNPECCRAYIWSNPGSGSVVCGCGSSRIYKDVVLAGDPVTDEEEWVQAVANDLTVPLEDLVVREA